jgi:LTXXQ motif family protein
MAHNALAHNALAHNALAHNVGRYHGLNTFNRNGFNRNAFGSQAAWNHWGANHWGPGWNNWGTGGGVWAGSVFWPFFWGDLLTCGVWPNAYFCPFWAYGPDFFLTSIFWPGPYYRLDYANWPYGYGGLYDIYGGYGYGYRGYGYAHRYTSVRHRHAPVPTEQFGEQSQTQACSGLAPGITDLPFDHIERVIRPTGDQMTALDALKSASDRASEALKASCPTEVPLTPMARLDAMQKRLEAMLHAVQTIRTPLETFYDSLTDEQRQRFNAIGGSPTEARNSSPATGLANLCSPQSESFTQLPLQRIDETIQPSEQQQTALNDLKAASSKAASELQASCPTEVPQTLAERLEAITKRLDAMVQAGKTIRPALNSFYASLSDEQKARFNVIGQHQGQPASQATSRGD